MTLEIVADKLAFPKGPVALPDGDLLVVEVLGGRLTRVARDGTKRVVVEIGGGPNGAAIGPMGAATFATMAASRHRGIPGC